MEMNIPPIEIETLVLAFEALSMLVTLINPLAEISNVTFQISSV